MALAMVQELPAPPELLPDDEDPELPELLPDDDDPELLRLLPDDNDPELPKLVPDDEDPELSETLTDDDPPSSDPDSLPPLELEHPTPTSKPRLAAKKRDVMGNLMKGVGAAFSVLGSRILWARGQRRTSTPRDGPRDRAPAPPASLPAMTTMGCGSRKTAVRLNTVRRPSLMRSSTS